MTKAKSMSPKNNGLRRRAEKILPLKGKVLQRKPPEDGEKRVHELQIQAIELER
jgi:hypothetical protein